MVVVSSGYFYTISHYQELMNTYDSFPTARVEMISWPSFFGGKVDVDTRKKRRKRKQKQKRQKRRLRSVVLFVADSVATQDLL